MAMIYPLRTFFPPLKKLTLSPGIRLKHRSIVLEGAGVKKSLTGLTSRDQKCFLFNSIRGVCGKKLITQFTFKKFSNKYFSNRKRKLLINLEVRLRVFKSFYRE